MKRIFFTNVVSAFRRYGTVLPVFLAAYPFDVFSADNYQVNSGATVRINEQGTCADVGNGTGSAIMVPTRSAAEWTSFRNGKPAGVSANICCAIDWSGTGWTYVGIGNCCTDDYDNCGGYQGTSCSYCGPS